MMDIKGMDTERVFHYFEQISRIPHGSGNTKKISNYIVRFAKENNLKYYQDSLDNVIIIKEASKGYENSPSVILQGHMDMVCEKDAHVTKDMEKEGLDIAVDGDYIYAKGTTLGGDDGIAVAMMMAILEDDSLLHPRLEAVFTSDEEVGMTGATGLDTSLLEGKIMLNIDSEEEGVFIVSCAGGNVTKCILPIKREKSPFDTCSIRISGLCGGHSGCEIHKNSANSTRVMARLLKEVSDKVNIRLISINGGLKDNAIPVDTVACVAVEDKDKLNEVVSRYKDALKDEFSSTDPMMKISVTKCSMKDVMDEDSTFKLINMLNDLPNGVQSMSESIENLVETSLNMGIAKTYNDRFELSFCIRSNVDLKKEQLTGRIINYMHSIGGKTAVSGDYPGWEYKRDSRLRDVMSKVFLEQYGYMPKVEALHAGLECGIFSGKIDNLDCISFGPDIEDIHTPREKMSVSSVERVWKMVKNVLRML